MHKQTAKQFRLKPGGLRGIMRPASATAISSEMVVG